MKKSFLIPLILVCLLLGSTGSRIRAQTGIEPSKLKQFNITVNYEDYTVKTQMLSQPKNISVNNERMYLWYASQKIMETKGGFDGKLIHGTYRAFYLNNQLKEKGEIRYGLKHKEWKYWYPDGKLREVINWKNGVKNGKYYLYNDYGQLMAQSRFKDDKLNGNFYTYNSNGKVIDKKRYKHGDEIPVKIKTRKPKEKKTENPKPETKPEVKPDQQNSENSEGKKPFLKNIFKKKTKKEKEEKTKDPEKRKVINS